MHDHHPTVAAPAACPAHQSTRGLADTLRDSTREAHVRAERHPIQVALIQGGVSRQRYGAYIAQLLPVWTALDRAVAALAANDPRAAAMLQPYHPHAGRIVADLRFLGESDRPHEALPATRRFVDLVETCAARGPGVLGIWYVLEGSANGGRFIAKSLSRSLGIAGPEGLTSFDPHGELQRERWQAWRVALDGQNFADGERDLIVQAASAAFEAISEVMDDLSAPPQPR